MFNSREFRCACFCRQLQAFSLELAWALAVEGTVLVVIVPFVRPCTAVRYGQGKGRPSRSK